MAAIAPVAQGMGSSIRSCCWVPVRPIPGTTAAVSPRSARYQRAYTRRRGDRIRAGNAPEDCNEEDCAPSKEIGKISLDWVAEERTKVTGTYPPLARTRAYTGYVEKDTAGQTNVYAVEPTVYVAESAVSSGTAGKSADGSENTLAVSFGLGLIAVAGAAGILINLGKNAPAPGAIYSGPPLSYYIEKFSPPVALEAAAPVLEEAPELAVQDDGYAVESPADGPTTAPEEAVAPDATAAAEATDEAAAPETLAGESTLDAPAAVDDAVLEEAATPAEIPAPEAAAPAETTAPEATEVQSSADVETLAEEPASEVSQEEAVPVADPVPEEAEAGVGASADAVSDKAEAEAGVEASADAVSDKAEAEAEVSADTASEEASADAGSETAGAEAELSVETVSGEASAEAVSETAEAEAELSADTVSGEASADAVSEMADAVSEKAEAEAELSADTVSGEASVDAVSEKAESSADTVSGEASADAV